MSSSGGQKTGWMLLAAGLVVLTVSGAIVWAAWDAEPGSVAPRSVLAPALLGLLLAGVGISTMITGKPPRSDGSVRYPHAPWNRGKRRR